MTKRAWPLLALLALAGGVALAASPTKQATKRPEDHVRGKQIYDRSCWQCHGKEGHGDGPAAAALPGGVPDLAGKVSADTYEAQITVILEGRGKMPAFSEEMDRQDARRALIHLDRTLNGVPEEPAPAKEDEGGGEGEAGG